MQAGARKDFKIIQLRRVPTGRGEGDLVRTGFPGKLVVALGQRVELIDVTGIIYCKADSNYTEIHLSNGRRIILSKTLKWTEMMLRSYPFFYRFHQSYLVNKNYITAVDKSDAWHLEIADGIRLPVSRSGRLQLSELIHQ